MGSKIPTQQSKTILAIFCPPIFSFLAAIFFTHFFSFFLDAYSVSTPQAFLSLITCSFPFPCFAVETAVFLYNSALPPLLFLIAREEKALQSTYNFYLPGDRMQNQVPYKWSESRSFSFSFNPLALFYGQHLALILFVYHMVLHSIIRLSFTPCFALLLFSHLLRILDSTSTTPHRLDF